MDKTSLSRVALMHPLLRTELANILSEIEQGGVSIRLTQTLRTIQEQNDLYAIGRTKPGKIVTNAKGGQSYHNYGLACFDENTRIITNQGFKYFYELDGTEEVLTFKDGNLEYQKPTNYISNDFDGDLIRIKTRSTDLLVTPNHKMITNRKINNKWSDFYEEILAEDLSSKHRIPTSGISIHNNNSLPIFNQYNVKLNIENSEDWWEFMGYYLSEGSCCGTSDNIPRTHGTRFSIKISQYKDKNPEVWDKIKKCLDRLGFRYYYYGHDFTINNKALWEILFPLGNSYKKYIPKYLLYADQEHLKKLYYALVDGDGSYYDNGEAYFSVSKNLVEDFSQLSLLINKSCSISSRFPKKYLMPHGKYLKTFNTQYIARTRLRTTQELRNGDGNSCVTKQYYKGIVYCVSTVAGAIVVERNGKISIAGNCDFCLLHKDGSISWNMHEDLDKDGIADWMEVVKVFKKYGWKWGGDFLTFRDTPHFEKTFGKSLKDLQNCKKDKDGYPII